MLALPIVAIVSIVVRRRRRRHRRRRHWRHRRRLRVRDLSHFIDTQRRFRLRIAMSPYQLASPLPHAFPPALYTAQAGGSSSSSSSSLALAFVRIARAYFFNKFSVYSVYLFTYICYCCPPPYPPSFFSCSVSLPPHFTSQFPLYCFCFRFVSLCFTITFLAIASAPRLPLHTLSVPLLPPLCLSVSAISFVVVFFVIEFQLVCIVDDNSSSYFAY